MKPSASAILRQLRATATKERRDFAKGYMPTSMKILGNAVPDIRKVSQAVSKELKTAEAEDVMGVIEALLASNTFEARQAAYEILARHKPAMLSLNTRKIEALGKGIDNWASVDSFCCEITGRAWRLGKISDAAVHRWARSKDLWWRRAALASTIPLNMASRGASPGGDVPRTLAVCELLVADHAEMVAKALSWALRAAIPHDRQAVEQFLERHQDTLPRRVIREVSNKLDTGKKNR